MCTKQILAIIYKYEQVFRILYLINNNKLVMVNFNKSLFNHNLILLILSILLSIKVIFIIPFYEKLFIILIIMVIVIKYYIKKFKNIEIKRYSYQNLF